MTKLQKLLVVGCLVLATVLASVMCTLTNSEVLRANYWQALQEKTYLDKTRLSESPDQPQAMENLAMDFWLSRNWDEAWALLDKSRNWYLRHKEAGYAADYERSMLRLGDLSTDKGDFSKARDLYSQLAQYDRVTYGSASPQSARDYNNIGLCSFLVAKTKASAEDRRGPLLDAMTNYRQAEQIFSQFHLNAQLTCCLQNQSAALFLLGQTDEAKRLRDIVQSRLTHGCKNG